MTLTPPTSCPGVYELYWQFAAKRQDVFERRLAGLSQKQWTNDPILQTYKFCNVFRAADRVSQYMISDVAYSSGDTRDRVFRIVAFRTFSQTYTWRAVKAALNGEPTLEHLRTGAFQQALKTRLGISPMYTNAFILCATKAYGFDKKYQNHVAMFKHMFLQDDLASKILDAKSLQQVVALLQEYPLMGPFMAYQTAIDLNYSDVINFSENDYTQAGPGALRGLKKCFTDFGDYKSADVIKWMVDNQDKEFERLGLKFNGLFGRKLHAIDCQGLFCETDKYCREARPELSSARSKIKAKFEPSPKPLPLFFPPKWGINNSRNAVPAPKITGRLY